MLHGQPRVTRLAVALLGLLLLTALSNSVAAAGSKGDDNRRAEAAETDGVNLQGIIERKGALGYYWDDRTAELVVALPSSGVSGFRMSDVAGFTAKVRIEHKSITRGEIKGIEKALLALRADLEGSGYAFYFDAASGKVVLQSDAPKAAFASVFERYPGKIDFHLGSFKQTAGWNNPVEPFIGGAFLNGPNGRICTSGYVAKNGAGTRFMITAGHCFGNGDVTNMGTTVRTDPPWSYYDLEKIRSKSYAGGIYDSANTSRAVTHASNPSIGTKYCTTGRTTGFVCTWKMRSLNVTICYPSGYPGCAHGLAGYYPDTDQGVQYLEGGDSGGPLWYKYANGGAGVRGVNSGTFFDIATFRVYSYSTMYQYVGSEMGLTAVISPIP